jgi:hypothetical protein
MQQARNLRFITDQNELKKIDFQDFNDEKAGRIKIDDESWNYIGNNSTDVTEIIYYKKTGAAAPPPYYEFRYTDSRGRPTIVFSPKPDSTPMRPIYITKYDID